MIALSSAARSANGMRRYTADRKSQAGRSLSSDLSFGMPWVDLPARFVDVRPVRRGLVLFMGVLRVAPGE
jgi:hypothetical protein